MSSETFLQGHGEGGSGAGPNSGDADSDRVEIMRLRAWLGGLEGGDLSGLVDKLTVHGITKVSIIELLQLEDLLQIGISLQDSNRVLRGIERVRVLTRDVSEAALAVAGSTPLPAIAPLPDRTRNAVYS